MNVQPNDFNCAIGQIDPARIDFAFNQLDDGQSIGDLVFFNDGRIPGSIAIGNQGFLYNEAFELRFAEDYIARSPGVVETQRIVVDLRGQAVEFQWDHNKECARWWYGVRPIIEIVTPAGEVWLYSYRPLTPVTSSWCRLVPTLLPGRRPKGSLSFRLERTFELCLYGIVFAFSCLGSAETGIHRSHC